MPTKLLYQGDVEIHIRPVSNNQFTQNAEDEDAFSFFAPISMQSALEAVFVTHQPKGQELIDAISPQNVHGLSKTIMVQKWVNKGIMEQIVFVPGHVSEVHDAIAQEFAGTGLFVIMDDASAEPYHRATPEAAQAFRNECNKAGEQRSRSGVAASTGKQVNVALQNAIASMHTTHNAPTPEGEIPPPPGQPLIPTPPTASATPAPTPAAPPAEPPAPEPLKGRAKKELN